MTLLITIIFLQNYIRNPKTLLMEKKLLLIEEHLYNPENTITDSQKVIIINHIYQHYLFHISKHKDENPAFMTAKIQELPDNGNAFIAKRIRNIDIDLNPMFLSYIYVVLQPNVILY